VGARGAWWRVETVVPYSGDRNMPIPYRLGPFWVDIHSVEELGRVEVVTCLLGILFGEEVWLRR
jgi:hypothetical protein